MDAVVFSIGSFLLVLSGRVFLVFPSGVVMTCSAKLVGEKLSKFRSLFNCAECCKAGGPIDAYLLPRTDAHNNEYIAPQDERVRFLSGFSGTNAFAIVTKSQALLWTDGRYVIQAKEEMDEGWTLMEEGTSDSISPTDWLFENMPNESTIGFDPRLYPFDKALKLMDTLRPIRITAVPVTPNLVDILWRDRPTEKTSKVTLLKLSECGKESAEKIKELRASLVKKKCDSAIFTALDDIAWLMNIRGGDIPYNPLVFSILVLTPKEVHLFINTEKLDNQDKESFVDVVLHEYDEAAAWLKSWHNSEKEGNRMHKVLIADSTNYYLGSIIDRNYSLIAFSPVQQMKAIKNSVELNGMRKAHLRDSAAVIEFLVWLEEQLDNGKNVTELSAASQIDQIRSFQPNFVGPSFKTISAVDDHAAKPHYSPNAVTGQRLIEKGHVYLFDSGGHYRDGTTDVTRTVVIGGEPDKEFRHEFTLVLKGHIQNAITVFPQGIHGMRLDVISRQFLWREGLNFGHGVGHGVGHFLNVHEGPGSISFRVYTPEGTLHRGMIMTIEPGYYREGKWGMRIENCYEITQATNLRSGSDDYLTFSPLTLVPIQRDLIDKSLLSTEELKWIDDYHGNCLTHVGTFFKEQRKTKELIWLQKACSPL